jgi:AcrR family transcriptional regulator
MPRMPRKSPPPPPPPPYHHGDLRTALLASALQILKREGPSALSLREVARTAGVSHQAPYHHFASREHLLAAVATEGFEQLALVLRRLQAGAKNPVEAARDTGVAYVTFAAANPERFRLMFGGEIGARDPYPDLVSASQRVFALLLAPFGMTPTPGRAPNPIALTLWSSVHGLASLAVDKQVPLAGKALETAARAMTERVWLGVREAIEGSSIGREAPAAHAGSNNHEPPKRSLVKRG